MGDVRNASNKPVSGPYRKRSLAVDKEMAQGKRESLEAEVDRLKKEVDEAFQKTESLVSGKGTYIYRSLFQDSPMWASRKEKVSKKDIRPELLKSLDSLTDRYVDFTETQKEMFLQNLRALMALEGKDALAAFDGVPPSPEPVVEIRYKNPDSYAVDLLRTLVAGLLLGAMLVYLGLQAAQHIKL